MVTKLTPDAYALSIRSRTNTLRALRAGTRCQDLMTVYYEKHFEVCGRLNSYLCGCRTIIFVDAGPPQINIKNEASGF